MLEKELRDKLIAIAAIAIIVWGATFAAYHGESPMAQSQPSAQTQQEQNIGEPGTKTDDAERVVAAEPHQQRTAGQEDQHQGARDGGEGRRKPSVLRRAIRFIENHDTLFNLILTFVIAAFTVVLAVATMSLGVSTEELRDFAEVQSGDMKESVGAAKASAEAAKTSADTAKMALDRLERGRIFPVIDLKFDNQQDPESRVYLSFQLINFGRSVAIMKEFVMTTYYVQHFDESIQTKQNVIFWVPHFIDANQKHTFEYTVMPQGQETYRAPGSIYRFSLRIAYTDIFGADHTEELHFRGNGVDGFLRSEHPFTPPEEEPAQQQE
jgi:hypothetical protein